jgi:hypothetical protein
VNKSPAVGTPRDNGGRRSGRDRRQFSYTGHIPERRVREDLRQQLDRRSGLDRRAVETRTPGIDRRNGKEQRFAFA